MFTNTNSEIIIRDTQDKPVTFTGPWAIRAAKDTATAVEQVMGYRLDVREAGGTWHLIPDTRFNSQDPLTVPERAIVAAFATYFSKYAVGLERDATVTIPRIVAASECNHDDMAEVGFKSEARAYAFAEVINRIFDYDAEPIAAPNGYSWLVAISSAGNLDGGQYEQLRGACEVAKHYRLKYARDGADDAQDAPSQDYPDRNNDAQRAILTRLDAIMERLDPVASVAKATTGEGEMIELRKPSKAVAKTGKKVAKKTA